MTPGGSGGGDFVGLWAAIGVVFLLFMVLRAVVLWYWRVNEIVAILQRIDERLARQEAARAPSIE